MVEEQAEIMEEVEGAGAPERLAFSCGTLHEAILAHPDWRVVKGIKGTSDAICPLAFDYGDGTMRFSVDLASTQNHRHAMCEEILDAVGDVVDEASYFQPVMFRDISARWEDAEPFVKLAYDASVKWIKIYTAD